MKGDCKYVGFEVLIAMPMKRTIFWIYSLFGTLLDCEETSGIFL
jgi:hypothetical protein